MESIITGTNLGTKTVGRISICLATHKVGTTNGTFFIVITRGVVISIEMITSSTRTCELGWIFDCWMVIETVVVTCIKVNTFIDVVTGKTTVTESQTVNSTFTSI